MYQKLTICICGFLFSLLLIQNYASAAESEGTIIPTTNSKRICGLEFCSKPMTIEEKIQIYLQDLRDKYSDSFVFQQGIGAVMVGSTLPEPIAQASPTVVAKAFPSTGPLIASQLPMVQAAAPEFSDSPAINATERENVAALGSIAKDLWTKESPPVVAMPRTGSIDEPPSATPYVPPQIGLKLSENQVESFSPGLSFLEGTDFHLSFGFSLDDLAEMTTYDSMEFTAFDDARGQFLPNIDCDDFSGIFTTAGEKQFSCKYNDGVHAPVQESATISVVHYDPVILIRGFNSTINEEVFYDLSVLEKEIPVGFEATLDEYVKLFFDDDSYEILAFDFIQNKFVKPDCTDFGEILSTEGPQQVTCTYTDRGQKKAQESFQIKIIHEPPVIGLKGKDQSGKDSFYSGLDVLANDLPLGFESTLGEYVKQVVDDSYEIAAFDFVSNKISNDVDCTNFESLLSSEGPKKLTCQYTDHGQKETKESVPINVVHQAPEIGFFYPDERGELQFETQFSKLPTKFVQDSPEGAYVPLFISARDYIKGEYVEVDCGLPNNNILPVGPTKLSCNYTDSGGKSDSENAIIEIVKIEKPSLVMEFQDQYYPFPEEDLEFQTDDPSGLFFEFSIIGLDNGLGEFSTTGLSCNGIPRDFIFPAATTKVTCEFTDSIGQSVSGSMNVKIQYLESSNPENESLQNDNSDQSLWIFVPEDTVISSDDPNGAVLDFEAMAIDEYEGEVSVKCTPPTGSLFPSGKTNVKCTAENSLGEIAEDSFILEIETKVESVPNWIKQNALWWAQSQIDDQTFANGIQYFVKEGIIVVPITSASSSETSSKIPDWIKQNAGWWATDQIPDSAFIDGLQYLISNGIVKVN